jgi:hypothetical protein
VFTFHPFKIFFGLSDIEIVERDHHVQAKKIIALNSHLIPPNLAKIFPLIYLE